MKGLKAFSDLTKKEQKRVNGRNIWIPLYYNVQKDTVYAKDGEGRSLVTHILNAVSPAEVKDLVVRWLWQ